MTVIQPVKTIMDLSHEAKASNHMPLNQEDQVLLLRLMKKLHRSEVAAHMVMVVSKLGQRAIHLMKRPLSETHKSEKTGPVDALVFAATQEPVPKTLPPVNPQTWKKRSRDVKPEEWKAATEDIKNKGMSFRQAADAHTFSIVVWTILSKASCVKNAWCPVMTTFGNVKRRASVSSAMFPPTDTSKSTGVPSPSNTSRQAEPILPRFRPLTRAFVSIKPPRLVLMSITTCFILAMLSALIHAWSMATVDIEVK
ncbi:hypothetical protein PsorP6_011239 [Peronosclerospora sorghi]|uniref:Uncharacterized protein n=1 Tax=Peronosclerospora sorghi TaxID=230839 RepID=A0ACC0WKM1_9STRA|nr:hypothetical protein PsorP6_011239 [Peronosclerospora sorghi]